jgi:hypothetical protein
MATLTPANLGSPQAIVHYYVDLAGNTQQVSGAFPYPIQQYTGSVNITTAGTTTCKATAGAVYGCSVLTAGTASTIQILDGTRALTPVVTNTAVGSVSMGIPTGIAAACATSVIVITAGTAVSTSVVWFV